MEHILELMNKKCFFAHAIHETEITYLVCTKNNKLKRVDSSVCSLCIEGANIMQREFARNCERIRTNG